MAVNLLKEIKMAIRPQLCLTNLMVHELGATVSDTKAEWTAYTGSDEQIAEMRQSEHGFVCRNNETGSGILSIKYGQLFSDQSEYPILNAMWKGSLKLFIDTNNTTHYLICDPHPLADMICQQARTGQPVWVRQSYYDQAEEHHGAKIFTTTIPDWNIPGAEYSFTEFKEEV